MAGKAKKRKWVIVLIVLALIVIAIGVFAYIQANNLKAVSYMKYTPKQRQELLIENEGNIQKILERIPAKEVTPLNEEQEEMLKSGELTEEEAIQIMTGKLEPILEPSPEYVGDTSASELEPTPMSEEEPEEAEEDKLQELIARVYILRVGFTGRLDSLIGQAKKEYVSQGGKNVTPLIQKYIGLGTDLESQCDAQMEALLSEIQAELERIGGDTSVIADIRESYQNEKSIKKAALLDMY